MKRSAQPLPSGAATNDGARADAGEAQLALEVVAEVLAAVVVAQAEPGGDRPARSRRGAPAAPGGAARAPRSACRGEPRGCRCSLDGRVLSLLPRCVCASTHASQTNQP